MFLSENLPSIDKTYKSAGQRKLLDTLSSPVAFRALILLVLAAGKFRLDIENYFLRLHCKY